VVVWRYGSSGSYFFLFIIDLNLNCSISNFINKPVVVVVTIGAVLGRVCSITKNVS
jgi:hypothetical protein